MGSRQMPTRCPHGRVVDCPHCDAMADRIDKLAERQAQQQKPAARTCSPRQQRKAFALFRDLGFTEPARHAFIRALTGNRCASFTELDRADVARAIDVLEAQAKDEPPQGHDGAWTDQETPF